MAPDDRAPTDRHKVVVEHLFKVFGGDAEETIRRAQAGEAKDRIYAETHSVAAVADISFSVDLGEIFVVMGLSGSGKSTLIRCLNRLIEPTRGRILLDGEDVLAMDAGALRRLRAHKLSMVFQHFALFPHKTVAENVEFGLKVRGMGAAERRDKALRALAQVGLEAYADVPPDNLSGGMQQRVGLARGLAVDPDIMLMDEPFSALDPLIRRDMQDELLALQSQLHMTILFITHDLHEALRIGDRIAIMKDGRFVQTGTPEEIVARPADDYVAAFTRDVDRGRVFRMGRLSRPAATVTLGDAPGEARRRCDDAAQAGIHVVDDDGFPLGIVPRADLDVLEDGGGELRALMRRNYPAARADQELIELYGACARGLPIAVLDAAGRLQGCVDPLRIFALLAGDAAAGMPACRSETAACEAAKEP
ncbi:quaternary amine ABC transporter ATP-binding protein [Halomonas organivorans]|uniref:Quaternary amine transport ATP-binding protein n=1 Tax=Halomonas organivorans TaxID=257772 RepID=A0A7W5BYT3_9GAMM|nr:glycine betaine/L-proline ABC transporter ATP-binding protein [Halomonas organivorans]MBB3141541.1 glycine betaine/proline transport system ATP-binding protein [Halomonas organivorans]